MNYHHSAFLFTLPLSGSSLLIFEMFICWASITQMHPIIKSSSIDVFFLLSLILIQLIKNYSEDILLPWFCYIEHFVQLHMEREAELIG